VPPGRLLQNPPPASAKPADKDAYVEKQLGKLFPGVAVRISFVDDALIGPFESSEMYDSALIAVSRAGSNTVAESDYRLGLFSFPTEAAARQKVQEALRSLTLPADPAPGECRLAQGPRQRWHIRY
jgi:hypothetical protein